VGKPEGKRDHQEEEDEGGWIIKWFLFRMGWYGLD
jgi:hypothetical protein